MSISRKPTFKQPPPPEHDPYILLHPNIPKPLHGIAPRVILGDEWWKKVKRDTNRDAREHCMACGVWKRKAKYHHWLECHEMYLYDWAKHTLTYDRTVAICHACHNFIHSGRLQILLDAGEISNDKYDDIMDHGSNLTCNLEDVYNFKPSPSNWSAWRMIVNGKKYGPSTRSYQDWGMGKWRNWKPKR